MGGDFIIIDDPIKNREEANSPTYRSKLWNWYISTLYTRLEQDAAILVTLTRWHEDDLAGRLLEAMKNPGGDEWTVVILPATRETDICHYDAREYGEPLWAGKYDLTSLATIKSTVGSYEWNALYQQRPAPEEGSLFKREWWQFYDEIPTDLFDYVQSWDCTFKDKSTSDFVVGQVWARSRRNPANRYLLDQYRKRMTFTETVQAIRTMSGKWPKTVRKLIEDKANGTAVIDVLKKEIPGLVAVEPRGGKVVRAHAVTAVVESGNVYLRNPGKAPWVLDFIEELASFPTGTHDDQVDAMTQANAYYNEKSKFDIRNLI